MHIETKPHASVADRMLCMTYKNWRGDVGDRHVTPIKIIFGSTEWHPEPQWLMIAWGHDKAAERAFAVKDCIAFKCWRGDAQS